MTKLYTAQREVYTGMIAFPIGLVGPANEAGIEVPPDLEHYDRMVYTRWHIYCVCQLATPLPFPAAHWDNAKIIAKIPEERLLLITADELVELGFKGDIAKAPHIPDGASNLPRVEHPTTEHEKDNISVHELLGYGAFEEAVKRAEEEELEPVQPFCDCHDAPPLGYEDLDRVLLLALEQASQGKGKERHATTQGVTYSFTEQPIMTLGRIYGHGYNCGQAAKKAHEAMELPTKRAMAELLGAINYLAAAYLLLEEKDTDESLCNDS